MKKTLNIILASLAILTTACALEQPETPVEELYMRNFIKRFGVIAANQDFNMAEASKVSLNLDKDASKIVVYANIFDHYYRVARCYNVEKGMINIPLDIPINTTDLVVEIDGSVYVTKPSGKVDASNNKPASRDGEVLQPYLNEDDALGWVIVSEDLGSIDDVDFNDFIAHFSYTENSYNVLGEYTPDVWDKIDQNVGLTDEGYISESRAGSRADGKTKITIKALASGGVKAIWLHYRPTQNGTDYIIGPSGAVQTTTLSEADAGNYEWHKWFGSNVGVMVNTGNGTVGPVAGRETVFEVDGDFSFTSYSRMTYAHPNPIDAFNFDFDRRQIEGFYISVDSHIVDINGSDVNAAFDVGRIIGQCRELGLPPQMFIIPDISGTSGSTATSHFKWPKERVSIDDAYDQFNTWVVNGNGDWYKDASSEQVVGDEYVSAIYKK